MKTINAGYTIIDRFTVGEQGFAVGESKTAPSPYVTWQYRAADPEHFFWGTISTRKRLRMRITESVLTMRHGTWLSTPTRANMTKRATCVSWTSAGMNR